MLTRCPFHTNKLIKSYCNIFLANAKCLLFFFQLDDWSISGVVDVKRHARLSTVDIDIRCFLGKRSGNRVLHQIDQTMSWQNTTEQRMMFMKPMTLKLVTLISIYTNKYCLILLFPSHKTTEMFGYQFFYTPAESVDGITLWWNNDN